MDTIGIHAVLYKLLHQSFKLVENVTVCHAVRKKLVPLLKYRKVSCRKKQDSAISEESPKIDSIFMVICPHSLLLCKNTNVKHNLGTSIIQAVCPVGFACPVTDQEDQSHICLSLLGAVHFVVGLYRRFLPCILIRIKIPLGSYSARAEDAIAIGQRRRAGG